MSCSGGKAWYVCSKGPFQGCCSIDPCDTGICPDDNNDDTDSTDSTDKSKPTPAVPAAPSSVSTTFTTSITSTTSTRSTKATGSSTTTSSRSASAPTETSTGVTESISITTSASISASSPLSPNSLSAEDSPSTTQTSTGLSRVLSTSSHTSSSGDKPNTGLIAGIAAGVAAALVLLGLLLCLIRRSRKKRGKRFTLLRWRGPMHECNENAPSPTRSVLHNILASTDSRYHESDNSPSRPRTAASRNSSIAGPGTETLVSLGSHTNSHSISSNPGIILTPPSSTTLSTPSSTLLTDPATSPTAALAISPNKNTGTSTSTRTTHSQLQLEPTPELSDTGFYRQRAELAAHSARELINVPLSQRLRPHHHRPSPRQSRVEATLSPNLRPPPAIPIVTADGVVLTSNLDQLDKDSSPRSAPGSDEDHVMSFMRYDAAKDAMLPAYRASLGRSSTGGAIVAGNENVSAWEEKERREVRR